MTRRRSTSRNPHRSAGAPAKGSGRLRLIGGEYRRRQLPVLDHPGLRPTPDRVRETLFNWLGAETPGARALDLCAGTGALGLEALSRGAREALFVEQAPPVAAQLADNLATLGASERARLVTADALAFLTAGPSDEFGVYSLVFLDPPFRQGLAAACCHALEQGWLANEALIYVETEASLAPDVPAGWALHREVQAGDSHGRLYRRRPAHRSPHADAC